MVANLVWFYCTEYQLVLQYRRERRPNDPARHLTLEKEHPQGADDRPCRLMG